MKPLPSGVDLRWYFTTLNVVGMGGGEVLLIALSSNRMASGRKEERGSTAERAMRDWCN